MNLCNLWIQLFTIYLHCVETWVCKAYTLSRNETKRLVNHHVSALASLPVAPPCRRRRPRICPRKVFEPHCDSLHGRLALLNNARNGRTAVGVHPDPDLVSPWGGHPGYSHDRSGNGRRQDRKLEGSLLLRLDTCHHRRDGALLRPARCARIVATTT